MIAVAAARFSGVWLSDPEAHEKTSALEDMQPATYRKPAPYLAVPFSVAAEMTKPITAINCGTEMCNPRSFRLSLDHAVEKAQMAASMYGGAVRRRVIVVPPRLKPLTMVGKKLMNP